MLCSFSSTVVWLPSGLWPIQFQVIGHPSSAGYGLHLVEWALSQIRQWLVIPTSFGPLLHQHLTGRTLLQIKGFVAELGFIFLLWQHTETCTKDTGTWVKDHAGTSCVSLCSVSHLVLSSATGLAISLWRAAYSLGNSLGCLEVSMGPLWHTTQLEVTHSWYSELHLVTREVQLGRCLPHYFEILFRSISYMHIFQQASNYIRFPYYSLNGP